MNNLYSLALRNLWTRKTRTLLTLFGIALGVAFVLAVNISNASTQAALESFFAQTSGRAHLTVSNAASLSVQTGIRASTLRDVQTFPGVIAAVAMTSDSAILVGKDNTNTRLTIVGIDPTADRQVRVYELTAGQFLDARRPAYEIVLPQPLADKHKVALHDRIELLIGREPQTFTVIGLLAAERKGAARIGNGSAGFVTLDVAREVFNRGNKIDQVDLIAEPVIARDSARLEQFRADLEATLGESFAVSYPAAGGQSISGSLNSITAGLSAFGVIALIVAAILIYNTFSMIALERTREWGLLRSLGTGRAQLFGLVLIEATCFALIGSALGLAGGLGLAFPLMRMMSVMMSGLLPIEATVPRAGIVAALASGILVTLIAALKPAWDVTRITPLAALRVRGEGMRRASFFMRHSGTLGLILIALATIDQVTSALIRQLTILPVELFLVAAFVGVALLVPTGVSLIERVIRRALGAIYGMPGRLGSLNLQRNRGRAALTASVMTIGAAMVIGMGGVEITFKAELDRWIKDTLTSDFSIGSSFAWFSTSYTTLPPEIGTLIAATPGIGAVTGEHWMYATATGATTEASFRARREGLMLRVIDPATYRTVAPLRFLEDHDRADELWQDLTQGDALFVSGLVQRAFHLRRGDTLRLRTPRGEVDVRVAGIVQDITQGGYTVIGTEDLAARYFGRNARGASLYFARVAPGADFKAVEQALKDGVGKSRRLDIVNSDDYRRLIRQAFDQFFALFDVVVIIAVFVGALGVVNSLTMSILERAREIAVLRSLGMTRAQIVWMVLAEALALGLIAALMGAGAGLALAAVLINGMSVNSGWQLGYIFPTVPLMLSLVITLVVSQLAALYPTWRAVRTVIVEAIQSE